MIIRTLLKWRMRFLHNRITNRNSLHQADIMSNDFECLVITSIVSNARK